MHLADLLGKDDIAFGIRGSDIGAAAAQLLQQTLPRRGFSSSDIQRLITAVIAREREAPTRCGTIAIPHARDPHLSAFVMAIGINALGVVDRVPTPRVIIAFLSPEAKRSEHLELLATLARLSRDQAAIDTIATATDPEAVLTVIRTRSG